MPAKDYYRILHSDPSASGQEIKRAYRKLVLKYHPDKNPANPFTENYFRDIQEAYEILSHPEKRRRYNQDRWFANGGFKNQYKGATVETIIIESRKLRDYAGKIDIFRMDHNSVHNHLMLLLSDSHLSVLLQSNDRNAMIEMVGNTIATMTNLKLNFIKDPIEKLLTLTSNQPELREVINRFIRYRTKKDVWRRGKPFFVLIVTLLLCLFIFIASRKY